MLLRTSGHKEFMTRSQNAIDQVEYIPRNVLMKTAFKVTLIILFMLTYRDSIKTVVGCHFAYYCAETPPIFQAVAI